MALTERGNYRIAVLTSIIFHLALVLIWIPVSPLHDTTEAEIETFGAGLVDLSGGGEPFQAPTEVVTNPPDNNLKQQLTQNVEKPKLVTTKTDAKQAPAVPNPSRNGAVAEVKPTKVKNAETGAATATSHPTVGGNPVQKPVSVSLGDGSGMIAGMGGGKLRAPKNVQNDEHGGEVVLRILVKADGTVEDILIQKKSSDDRLDNYTRNTVLREWKFKANKEAYQIDVSFDYQNINNYISTHRFISSETRP